MEILYYNTIGSNANGTHNDSIKSSFIIKRCEEQISENKEYNELYDLLDDECQQSNNDNIMCIVDDIITILKGTYLVNINKYI